jgi:catechol-2,3-dioxygenase
MRISRLDHLVLTVKSIEASTSFYTGVLGSSSRKPRCRPREAQSCA